MNLLLSGFPNPSRSSKSECLFILMAPLNMKYVWIILSCHLLFACSGMTKVEERSSYAQPDWYAKCVQEGKEGFFWMAKSYVYACGAGESVFAQAAEEQMYAIALNNFAKRINGRVNSETSIDMSETKKTSRTTIKYSVSETSVVDHLQKEYGHFTLAGRHYTFVRLKMPREVFDRLIQENRSR